MDNNYINLKKSKKYSIIRNKQIKKLKNAQQLKKKLKKSENTVN